MGQRRGQRTAVIPAAACLMPLPHTRPVKSATIDPAHAISDVERSNNTFTVQ